jgi:hypothetical protein
LAQKQLTEVKLQKYRTAAAEGQYGAENFIAREQQLLEGINRALSVDDHLFPDNQEQYNENSQKTYASTPHVAWSKTRRCCH